MAFRIERVDRPEDFVEFEVVDTNDKLVEFKIQKNNCLPPATVKKITDFIAAQPENASLIEINRETLKIICPEQKKLFDRMAARQMDQIFDHWNKESEMTLGESEASTSSST